MTAAIRCWPCFYARRKPDTLSDGHVCSAPCDFIVADGGDCSEPLKRRATLHADGGFVVSIERCPKSDAHRRAA